jgi:hypothetical protein
MDVGSWLASIADFSSIGGLFLSGVAAWFARRADTSAKEARKAVRRANASDALTRLGELSTTLQACVENDVIDEAKIRARDLATEISRCRLRYERFLPVESRERLDEARGQVSVISRSLTVRGRPATPAQKERMLRICHDAIVMVLNEESARIISAIESEEES